MEQIQNAGAMARIQPTDSITRQGIQITGLDILSGTHCDSCARSTYRMVRKAASGTPCPDEYGRG